MCNAPLFLQLDMLRPEEIDFGAILSYIRFRQNYDTLKERKNMILLKEKKEEK